MYIVFLRFSENKLKAPGFMRAHKAWIQQGVDDGAFMVVGSLKPDGGGCIIAHNLDWESIERRVKEDPFVMENIVKAEIVEVAPSMVDKRVSFLME